MKSQFKNTPIALAVAAMFLSPIAFAGSSTDGGQNGGNKNHDPVSITKDISLQQDIAIKGLLLVGGIAQIDASSTAIVNDAQNSQNNSVQNGSAATDKAIASGGSTNTSTITNNALSSASGNIGLNIGAGDNNQQANAAALSAADA